MSPLAPFDWDVDYFCISPDRRWLGFTVNENGCGVPHVRSLENGELRRAMEPNGQSGVAGNLDRYILFTPDSRNLVYSYNTPVRTSDIFCWDFNDPDNPPWPLTRSSHGGLPPEIFRPYELVHYPTFDGLEIPAWFCLPDDRFPRPLPVVVIVHGGPESQSQAAFNFLAQYLLEKGFALLIPNVRGSSGYGKAYGHLDDVEKRMDSVADLAHAAHWLGRQPQIDLGRMAVYGGSYGGFMVLSAMTAYPDLWAAGVDIVGISNFVTFLENTSAYRRAHREAEYGSLENDRAFLESISPIRHIEILSAPLMVIHGANDPRVPLGEAEQLVAALREQGTPVEYLVFEDEGHGLAKLKNKIVAYPAVADFLARHLQPES
jgi:dipeptidyl aminopeptidase/acylaminoacyl peptidase